MDVIASTPFIRALSDGENRVLYLQPIDFHQRTPFFVGSADMVKRAMSYFGSKTT